jgi:hypothetical protein
MPDSFVSEMIAKLISKSMAIPKFTSAMKCVYVKEVSYARMESISRGIIAVVG